MKSKKVGIITFHNARNYGATLQAYALQTKMSEICNEAEILDYENPVIKKSLKLWCPKDKSFKSFIKALLGIFFRFKKKVAFNKFEKSHLCLSKLANEKIIKNNQYDILITGSDQIWNTKLTGNDMHYFLDFARDNQFTMAYAASFGDSRFDIKEQEIELLKKIDKITLRENLLLGYVNKHSKNNVEICCDPALLLDYGKWKEITSKRLYKKPYIFLFTIKNSPKLTEYARKLATEKNIELISNKNDFKFFLHCSPNDFLSWINNAEYIVTNSFHATVFSLQFHKQFVSQTFDDEGTEKKRISGLLKNIDCLNRSFNDEKVNIDEQINWETIDSKIDEMKNQSLNIVKSSIL